MASSTTAFAIAEGLELIAMTCLVVGLPKGLVKKRIPIDSQICSNKARLKSQ
ncbi:hypothetical protein BH10CYA1_BH10CYA1_41980 [soil metagenome]